MIKTDLIKMVRAITLEEYNTLLNGCESYGHLERYLKIASITGLRVSEVLSITLSQLYDLENGAPCSTLHIKKANLKCGKKSNSTVAARYIKLPDYFKQYVTELIKHDLEQVKSLSDDDKNNFNVNGKLSQEWAKKIGKLKYIKVSDERIRQLLDKCVACNLPDILGDPISTHSIRKMYAVLAYEKSDKSIATVQAMLGHRNISSTGHYLKETICKVAEVTNAIHDSLG